MKISDLKHKLLDYSKYIEFINSFNNIILLKGDVSENQKATLLKYYFLLGRDFTFDVPVNKKTIYITKEFKEGYLCLVCDGIKYKELTYGEAIKDLNRNNIKNKELYFSELYL